jgi:hypothetical protein
MIACQSKIHWASHTACANQIGLATAAADATMPPGHPGFLQDTNQGLFNPMLNVVKIWILFSTLLVASGWILSALHQLNRAGYLAVFALAAVGCLWWQRKTKWRPEKNFRGLLSKFQRRFKRPAPLLFFVLVLMTLAAGALYVPLNNDANEYRSPRIWHWLAEQQWHWIRTLDFRMNVVGCNFEWLVTPLMLFTKHDRALFLANWISFLMLPGLVFSVFIRLGVRRRVAWWWMWILPSSWCYFMQAAADCNDSFAVIYALASIDFALRAREKNRITDLWLSILAIGLLTGAKQTDLPLVLPWLVAIIPNWRLAKNNALSTAGIGALALLSSALPLAYLNLKYAGSWMGMPANLGVWKLAPPPPAWCFIGNLFCIPAENLHPPIFPLADRWDKLMEHFLQTPFGSHFQSFENFGYMSRGMGEGDAGVGLWIVLLVCVSVVAAYFYRQKNQPPLQNRWIVWLRWAPFVSLAVFMAKVATIENARQLAAYYVLLFPVFLVASGHARLVREKWWQRSSLTAIVLSIAMLVIARDRPLFPANTILPLLAEKYPQWKFLAREQQSYACRLALETQRNAFRNTIPAEEKVLGYAAVRGEQEPGQWIPFGRRRVERVLPDDTASQLQAKGIHYVLVDSSGLDLLNMTIGDWTNHYGAVLVDSSGLETSPGIIATDYLVRLNPPGNK